MASVIETKINRLASAKAAIKAAIEGKGVTVPDATLLDGMATLIESIQAGGGGGGDIYTGSFSYESDKTFPSIPIENTGGKYPEWLAVWNESTASGINKLRIGVYHNKKFSSSGNNYIYQDLRLVYQTTYKSDNDVSTSTSLNTRISLSGNISSLKCYAGDIYKFVAFGEMKS